MDEDNRKKDRHRTPTVGWHPADAELKGWIATEARRRQCTRSDILEEMAAEYRMIRNAGRPGLAQAWHQLAQAVRDHVAVLDAWQVLPSGDWPGTCQLSVRDLRTALEMLAYHADPDGWKRKKS